MTIVDVSSFAGAPKARDIQQSQADSLIALVKSARPEGVGQNISVYA